MGGATPSQQTQQTNQTQNTNSTSGPNPTIAPMLGQGVNDLWSLYQNNPTAPGYYPGSTVATPSQATQSGWQSMVERGTNGLGYGLDAASRTNAADTLNGKYLDINNNPYFQGALAAGFAPQNRAFNDTILPNLRSQFEGSGRNLGGADMGTAQTALHNLSDSQSNAAATAANNAYGAERGLQTQTQSLLPGMANMDWQNVAGIAAGGAGIDAYSQRLTDADVAKYNYNQNAQKNYISDFLSRIQAGYPGGQTQGTGTSSGTTTGMGTPASNPTASGIGAGLGALGTIAQFLPFLPFSDERLKEDIKPVGKLHDGQQVYSYRLKGEPFHQIGLMAQEVEKRNPDAVVTDAAGWKHVDYAKATAPAGGLM